MILGKFKTLRKDKTINSKHKIRTILLIQIKKSTYLKREELILRIMDKELKENIQ